MRALLLAVGLLACDRAGDSKNVGIAPADPSLQLRGDELERFCTSKSIANRPGENSDCASFAACEAVGAGCDGPRNGSDAMIGCDPYLVCRAKPSRR